VIIIVAAGNLDAALTPLLDEFDRSSTPGEQEAAAARVFQLVGPVVKGMIQRAAQGRRLDSGELESLAWQALLRGMAESGVPRLRRTDGDWDEFVRKIRDQQTPPTRRIWSLLTDKLKRSMASPYLKTITTDELVKELNGLLRRRDLYDENAFAGVVLSDEGRQLLAKDGKLSATELVRFNSLLLASAFPEIEAPDRPRRNLLGYLSSTVIPQLSQQIWEAASGRKVDGYAIEAWGDLKPFVQELDRLRASGALPESFEDLSRAEQVYQLQKQRLSERYGPILAWWDDRVRDLQPGNPFHVRDRGSLRDAKRLLAEHADSVPGRMWNAPGSPYYVPAMAVAPYGVRSIERMLAAGRPKSPAPESQAAPQAPGAPPSQSYFMAAQPGAYQMMANRVYSDPGYDVERAVAAFLSGTPQPTPQQVDQFIASQPPQVAETIRDVGFPSIAQEVDQRILEHARAPETQTWLTNALGRQPQEVQAALLATRREVAARITRMSKPDFESRQRQVLRKTRTCGLTIICAASVTQILNERARA
jgi:hypothetical protein